MSKLDKYVNISVKKYTFVINGESIEIFCDSKKDIELFEKMLSDLRGENIRLKNRYLKKEWKDGAVIIGQNQTTNQPVVGKWHYKELQNGNFHAYAVTADDRIIANFNINRKYIENKPLRCKSSNKKIDSIEMKVITIALEGKSKSITIPIRAYEDLRYKIIKEKKIKHEEINPDQEEWKENIVEYFIKKGDYFPNQKFRNILDAIYPYRNLRISTNYVMEKANVGRTATTKWLNRLVEYHIMEKPATNQWTYRGIPVISNRK